MSHFFRMRALNLFLLVVSASGVLSCYRAKNTPLADTPPAFRVSASYSNGYMYGGGSIADSICTFSVLDSTILNLDLSFDLISGSPANYPITCTIGGLPNGCSVLPSNSQTFKLSYRPSFKISVNSSPGIYPFNINIQSQINGTQNYAGHLHVLPVLDGAPTIAGTYSCNDQCGFSPAVTSYSYTATVSTISGHPHWINIKNFRGLGDSVIVSAYVTMSDAFDPLRGYIDIPLQTVGGYTIVSRGRGYYGNNGKPYISVDRDTVIHAGDTQTCYVQLRQ